MVGNGYLYAWALVTQKSGFQGRAKLWARSATMTTVYGLLLHTHTVQMEEQKRESGEYEDEAANNLKGE